MPSKKYIAQAINGPLKDKTFILNSTNSPGTRATLTISLCNQTGFYRYAKQSDYRENRFNMRNKVTILLDWVEENNSSLRNGLIFLNKW